MKNHFATLILASLCYSAPGALFAGPQSDPTQPQTNMSFPTADAMVEMLRSKLSLSQGQTNAIAPIIADRQQKVRAILADTATGAMQRRRQAKGIFSDSDTKIKAILTPDQWGKYTLIEQQMREQMKQRMQQQ
jgi:protein CpxP